MIVIHLLSSLNSIRQTVFELESGHGNFYGQTNRQKADKEMLTARQTDKKQTNEQTELHQFQKEPSYDSDPPPLSSLNSIGHSVFEYRVRKQKC